MASLTLGITSFGGYVPPLRLSRDEVAGAHSWFNPALKALTKGERAAAGWDEDVITMAVDAARNCLAGVDRDRIGAVLLGTTTAPFADRLNSGLVAAALGLREEVTAQDIGGSQRAGLAALRLAGDCVTAHGRAALVLASERRATLAGSTAELVSGDGAAALIVEPKPGVARLLGSSSLNVDFVDHFRSQGAEFDYPGEQRWVREEGYLKIVPRAIEAALAASHLAASEVEHFCLPCTLPRVQHQVAKLTGIPHSSVSDSLHASCGDTGAAHPLVLLVRALEEARPGERILVAGFGQGADVMVFEATDAIVQQQIRGSGISQWLVRRMSCSYPRYLALNDLIKVDRGVRSEADKGTALTVMYRHRDLLTAMIGGRCERCGTLQIPRLRICVNPDCRAVDSQVPHAFSESFGRIVSWSADNLTYTPDPPAYYGMIDFEEGGRLMMDFADIRQQSVEVGMQMRMVFRIKDHDRSRNFKRYFWKATPVESKEG